MILDNGFGQNVTYLSKSPRNPTVSSKLVSVVGSHAMRDIECRKKHFAVWICWNKPWTCRVRAWQQDNYQEQDQMQLLLWFIHFYCICNEGCEADHWKVPISKIPQLTLSTHKGHCAYIRPTAEINARARNTHDKLWNLSEFLNLTTRVWWRGNVQRQRMSNLFGYLDVIFKRPLKSISKHSGSSVLGGVPCPGSWLGWSGSLSMACYLVLIISCVTNWK